MMTMKIIQLNSVHVYRLPESTARRPIIEAEHHKNINNRDQ